MHKKTEIRLQRAPWYHGAQVLVTHDGAYVTRIVCEQKPKNEAIEPSFTISDQAAQTLMDDLWHAGYRPTEGSGSVGSLRATEKHLDDMRKIVANKLEIDFEK